MRSNFAGTKEIYSLFKLGVSVAGGEVKVITGSEMLVICGWLVAHAVKKIKTNRANFFITTSQIIRPRKS